MLNSLQKLKNRFTPKQRIFLIIYIILHSAVVIFAFLMMMQAISFNDDAPMPTAQEQMISSIGFVLLLITALPLYVFLALIKFSLFFPIGTLFCLLLNSGLYGLMVLHFYKVIVKKL